MTFRLGFLTIVGLLSVVGCESREARKMAELRKTVLISSQPAQATTIAAAKEKITETKSVVIRGKIGAGDFEPFEKGKAVFTITEAPDDSHADEAGHDADNCPFCKRRAAQAAMALVKVVDASGNVLPFNAADLLGVKAGSIVALEGTAEYDEKLDLFTITTQSVCVLK